MLHHGRCPPSQNLIIAGGVTNLHKSRLPRPVGTPTEVEGTRCCRLAVPDHPRRILGKRKTQNRILRVEMALATLGFRRSAECCVGAARGNGFLFAPHGAGGFTRRTVTRAGGAWRAPAPRPPHGCRSCKGRCPAHARTRHAPQAAACCRQNAPWRQARRGARAHAVVGHFPPPNPPTPKPSPNNPPMGQNPR